MRRVVAFLTVFGGSRLPDPKALAWFPAVGAVLGLALGGLWWLAHDAWTAPVAAAVVVVADLAMTGLLHFDGLADAADGLLPHLSPERRLAVMASPETGAFGVAVVAVTILLRWAALGSLRPAPLLLGALWCLSRTSMAVVVMTQPYARAAGGGGLVSAFATPGSGPVRSGGAKAPVGGWWAAGLGLAVSVGLAAGWRPVVGPVALIAGALAGVGVVALGRRRLGGYTGDVLGAAGVLIETVGLAAAAARW